MKVLAVLVLCMIAGAAMAADVDADAHPKRAARKLVAAKKSEGRHSWGNQRVVMVPKGDPRAQSPPVPPAPVDPNAEQPIIVEAEEVQPKKHHRRYHNTADVTPAATAASAAAAVVPTARPILKAVAPAAAGACLKSYNGATAAAKASAYQANYKSRGVKYSQPNRQFGIGAKYADCSSFVTSILADVGMNCLFANGRYTAYMNEQIRARGGYKQTAKAGDIVMWGSHTGMIVKVCSSTTYSMVAMGNSGAGLAVCKTVAQLKSWGSGGWLGFWTPRP